MHFEKCLKFFFLTFAGLKLFFAGCCRCAIYLHGATPNLKLIYIMFFKQSHKLLFSHCFKLRFVFGLSLLSLFFSLRLWSCLFFLSVLMCICLYSLVIASKFNAGYSCAIITFLDKCAIMLPLFCVLRFSKADAWHYHAKKANQILCMRIKCNVNQQKWFFFFFLFVAKMQNKKKNEKNRTI